MLNLKQPAWSRIWTRVAVSISIDDNRFIVSSYLYFWAVVYQEILLGLGPIDYESFLNRFIRPIDWTLTVSTIPNQSGPGSYGIEEVSQFYQISKREDKINFLKHLMSFLKYKSLKEE